MSYFLGNTASTSVNITEASTQSQSTKSYHNLNSNNIPTKRRKLEEPPFGDIVIIERPEDIPQNTLACAVHASGGNIEWKFDKIKNSLYILYSPISFFFLLQIYFSSFSFVQQMQYFCKFKIVS